MVDIIIDNNVMLSTGYIPDTNEYCIIILKNEEGSKPGEYSKVYKKGDVIDESDDRVVCRLILPNIDAWYLLLEQLTMLGNNFLHLPNTPE